MKDDLITCETVAAIVVHLRRIATAPNYSGHVDPKPLALCGMPINWDTRLPTNAATCRKCLATLPASPR